MFQSLIERPIITQEVLTKITAELINRYEIKQIYNRSEFASDIARLQEQMRLYAEVLQELSPHTIALKAFHHQLFRLLDFLTRIASRPLTATPILRLPPAFCGGCSGLLQHRNIRQLHRQLLNCQQLTQEREERDSQGSVKQEAEITQEEHLVKRMGSLQQNITERQVNLVRCIDDFENMRNDLLLGLKKREFNRDFDSFDLKAYALQLTTHFHSTLTRVQEKIGKLKRSIHLVEDQAVQTCLTTDAPQTPACKPEPKPQNGRSEADFRKLNDAKIRLDESCRRYQLQLRETLSKLEAIQAQNKCLREEANNQRYRREMTQKSVKSAQRDEKVKAEESKRESLQSLLANQQALVGQFQTRFLQNYVGTGSGNGKGAEDEIVPIIKATFKRTFEGFFNSRLSLNLNSRPHLSPFIQPPQQQPLSGDRRSKSKRRSIRMQLDADSIRQLSRFSKKINPTSFIITTQINHKITPKPAKNSQYLKSSSSASIYKKAVVNTEGSVKGKHNRHSKLNSILTQYKEKQNNGDQLDIFVAKKYSQTMLTQHFEQLLPQARTVQGKGRKIKISRNRSQFFDASNIKAEEGEKEIKDMKALRLDGVRLTPIDSVAVKQFLFMSDKDLQSPFPHQALPHPSHKRDQQHLSVESLSLQPAIKKEKVILNLQEINYLTNFYSLLAKIHMIDSITYNKLREWIFSKGRDKMETGKQSMVLKQIVSQIVFKHRQCKLSSSLLCPHLIAFLRQMQRTLKNIQV